MRPADYRSGCDAGVCVRDDRNPAAIDMHEPALADTVLGEPGDALFGFADSWIRGQHFDDEVRCTAHPIADNPRIVVRNEHEIGLNDECALLVEDHVKRREPDFTYAARTHIGVKHPEQTG